jgi:hypothetical protein
MEIGLSHTEALVLPFPVEYQRLRRPEIYLRTLTYICSQIPRLNEEGGIQGHFYVHPNAISGNLFAPNEHANATQITQLWDPILEKMKSFPGINAKFLTKIQPASFGVGGLGSIQGGGGGAALNQGSGMAGMAGMHGMAAMK